MNSNKQNLINKIKYRSQYRGTKEMDILLSSFVNKYVDKLDFDELNDLNNLLIFEDEILHKWYFEGELNHSVPTNNVSKMFKNFKL